MTVTPLEWVLGRDITTTAPQSQLATASQVIEGSYPGEDDLDSEHGDLEANLADHQVVVMIT